jgi:hypothetical protein
MTMEPEFDFQPERTDQKKQNQPQSVRVLILFKFTLGKVESHPKVVEFELLDPIRSGLWDQALGL